MSILLFGSALVYVNWLSVLTKVSLNKANAFSFLVPVFGLTTGVMFYSETIGFAAIIGSSLTILGVWLVSTQSKVKLSDESASEL